MAYYKNIMSIAIFKWIDIYDNNIQFQPWKVESFLFLYRMSIYWLFKHIKDYTQKIFYSAQLFDYKIGKNIYLDI